MTSIRLVIFLSIITRIICTRSQISTLVTEVIRDFHESQTDELDFVIYGSEYRSVNRVKSIAGFKKINIAPIKLKRISDENSESEIVHSALLIFDTLKSYQRFNNRSALANLYMTNINFVVYILDM